MFGHDVIKTALVTIMGILSAVYIIGDSIQFQYFIEDLIFGDILKYRLQIQEILYKPGAGDPIDFRTFTGDPFHLSVG